MDTPKDFATIKKSDGTLSLRGWQISDHEEAILRIYLNGVEIEGITRYNRQDVFEAYQEAYAGDMDPDTIGWAVKVKLNDLELGVHKVDVQCLEPNGKILADKSIQFTLE